MLRLPIHGYWFAMILVGEKREEYRMAKPYWKTRIENERGLAITCGRHPEVEFVAGYGPTVPRAVFEIVAVSERIGKPLHPEWGEPADLHFVLRLGRRLSACLIDVGQASTSNIVLPMPWPTTPPVPAF